MKIIRVFPRRAKNYTPDDNMAFIGPPARMLIPPHDEVHISCVFTWDMELCEELKFQWEVATDKPVKLGGPAYDGPAYGSLCDGFVPGMYVKSNIIFTSRGCNNFCPWCCVPEREGPLRELPVCEGNVIQDNNFLQTSRGHKNEVFDMLKSQRGICFKGGLQNNLIDNHFIRNIQGLRIAELWLACDTDGALPSLEYAAGELTKAGYNRNKIRCYALIGDNMEANERRLQAIYAAGAMPFAQLYQPINGIKREYDLAWGKFQRMWSRPAATKAHVERGTSMWDH